MPVAYRDPSRGNLCNLAGGFLTEHYEIIMAPPPRQLQPGALGLTLLLTRILLLLPVVRTGELSPWTCMDCWFNDTFVIAVAFLIQRGLGVRCYGRVMTVPFELVSNITIMQVHWKSLCRDARPRRQPLQHSRANAYRDPIFSFY